MLLRLVAMGLCALLFLAPLITYSNEVITFCQEQGCTTPPLIEEEEVAHAAIPPGDRSLLEHPTMDMDKAVLPHWEELLLHTLHGEVPHPPPWA
jgi:hypothetical protein